VHGTGATLADTAAKLGARELQMIANNPQQRRVFAAVKCYLLGIDFE
jgi:hypothetical protein